MDRIGKHDIDDDASDSACDTHVKRARLIDHGNIGKGASQFSTVLGGEATTTCACPQNDATIPSATIADADDHARRLERTVRDCNIEIAVNFGGSAPSESEHAVNEAGDPGGSAQSNGAKNSDTNGSSSCPHVSETTGVHESHTATDSDGEIDTSDDEHDPGASEASDFVRKQRAAGKDPLEILGRCGMDADRIRSMGMPDAVLWGLVAQAVGDIFGSVADKKEPLTNIDAVVDAIRKASKILILTGAGISTSCGIPDFRSANGIYARLKTDFPTLPDPHAMFDMEFFRSNPEPFFDFAAEIYPGKFEPAPCHRFIRAVELKNKLLRNYTQNIDTLEQVAGIQKAINCHGSFKTASCMVCGYRVPGSAIEADVMEKRIPICPRAGTRVCPYPAEPTDVPQRHPESAANPHPHFPQHVEHRPRPVMKPDIVFFGQGLPEEFHDAIVVDRDKADLVIVIGSSLKVSPVAKIPHMVRHDIPQILINREPLPHLHFSAELLGNCDEILMELAARLQWDIGSAPAAADSSRRGAPAACSGAKSVGVAGVGAHAGATPTHVASEGAHTTQNSTTDTHGAGCDTVHGSGTTNEDVRTHGDANSAAATNNSSAATNNSGGVTDNSSAATDNGVPDNTGPAGEVVHGTVHDFRFVAPNRFIFTGAMLESVHSDSDDSDSDDADNDATNQHGPQHEAPCPPSGPSDVPDARLSSEHSEVTDARPPDSPSETAVLR